MAFCCCCEKRPHQLSLLSVCQKRKLQTSTVTRHIHTMTHQKNAKGVKDAATLSFPRSDGDSMRLKVLTNAVVRLAEFVCVQ